jgi:rhodanese-related sulfurtransferase
MKRMLFWMIALTLCTAGPVFAASVGLMDKDQLQAQLGSEKLVILDVRQGKDWSASEYKIKGALRVDGGDLSVADSYAKDTTMVLYCA